MQIIEGVGKKVESLLKDGGYKTWDDVAKANTNDLQAILKKAGGTYAMMDPSTWPTQAKLAADGRWDDLVSYQMHLDGGKESGDGMTDAKVEKLGAKIAGIKLFSPDDLKIVEGIGPKIEDLMKADGINNWSDLAGASTDRLQGILDKAGDNYRLADPSTWPQQAGLAANAKWAELQKLQDELDGGRKK